jgi:hypothetical protein
MLSALNLPSTMSAAAASWPTLGFAFHMQHVQSERKTTARQDDTRLQQRFTCSAPRSIPAAQAASSLRPPKYSAKAMPVWQVWGPPLPGPHQALLQGQMQTRKGATFSVQQQGEEWGRNSKAQQLWGLPSWCTMNEARCELFLQRRAGCCNTLHLQEMRQGVPVVVSAVWY